MSILEAIHIHRQNEDIKKSNKNSLLIGPENTAEQTTESDWEHWVHCPAARAGHQTRRGHSATITVLLLRVDRYDDHHAHTGASLDLNWFT